MAKKKASESHIKNAFNKLKAAIEDNVSVLDNLLEHYQSKYSSSAYNRLKGRIENETLTLHAAKVRSFDCLIYLFERKFDVSKFELDIITCIHRSCNISREKKAQIVNLYFRNYRCKEVYSVKYLFEYSDECDDYLINKFPGRVFRCALEKNLPDIVRKCFNKCDIRSLLNLSEFTIDSEILSAAKNNSEAFNYIVKEVNAPIAPHFLEAYKFEKYLRHNFILWFDTCTDIHIGVKMLIAFKKYITDDMVHGILWRMSYHPHRVNISLFAYVLLRLGRSFNSYLNTNQHLYNERLFRLRESILNILTKPVPLDIIIKADILIHGGRID